LVAWNPELGGWFLEVLRRLEGAFLVGSVEIAGVPVGLAILKMDGFRSDVGDDMPTDVAPLLEEMPHGIEFDTVRACQGWGESPGTGQMDWLQDVAGGPPGVMWKEAERIGERGVEANLDRQNDGAFRGRQTSPPSVPGGVIGRARMGGLSFPGDPDRVRHVCDPLPFWRDPAVEDLLGGFDGWRRLGGFCRSLGRCRNIDGGDSTVGPFRPGCAGSARDGRRLSIWGRHRPAVAPRREVAQMGP
jgi:hypothetical protein